MIKICWSGSAFRSSENNCFWVQEICERVFKTLRPFLFYAGGWLRLKNNDTRDCNTKKAAILWSFCSVCSETGVLIRRVVQNCWLNSLSQGDKLTVLLQLIFSCGSEGLCWVCHHFFPPDKEHSVPCLFIRQTLLLRRDLLRYTRCIVCKEQWRCQKAGVVFSPFSEVPTVAPSFHSYCFFLCWCPHVIIVKSTEKPWN